MCDLHCGSDSSARAELWRRGVMAEGDFVQFSWHVRYRFRALANTLLRRIAEEHNVYFHVRTVAEDPDPAPVDPASAPDPVRLAQGVTLPSEAVDRLRQAATRAEVHIYVNPGWPEILASLAL